MKLALVFLLLVAATIAIAGLWLEPRIPAGFSRWVNPISYEEEIWSAAQRHDLDPYLVLAVVKCESSFRSDARSPAGAVGLMQLLPSTAEWIAGQADWDGPSAPELTVVGDNLALGCYYLRFLLELYQGDQVAAVAAYHAGQGTVGTWLSEAGGTLLVEDIPYPETRDYVQRVLDYRELYVRIYPPLGGGEIVGAGAASGLEGAVGAGERWKPWVISCSGVSIGRGVINNRLWTSWRKAWPAGIASRPCWE